MKMSLDPFLSMKVEGQEEIQGLKVKLIDQKIKFIKWNIAIIEKKYIFLK